MINNYKIFNETLILERMLLESKLELSEKLLKMLETIPDDKIRNKILNIASTKKDLQLVQNYIDLSDNKEELTFIQDRRAKEILMTSEEKWKPNDEVRNRYLTFNKNNNGEYKNKVVFDLLGFTPPEGVDADNLKPNHSEVGIIKNEVLSPVSGKTFVLFEFIRNGETLQIVLNKTSLEPHDDRYNKIWSLNRNPIRIGRLVRSILNTAGEQYTDRDIEIFVNNFKSSWDIMNNALARFSVVNGDDIGKWYNRDNYESHDSTLGNSCMSTVPKEFMDLYSKNPEVCSLVILYSSKSGSISGDKWISDKICGRALLWKTDSGEYLMDRIYYNDDSDVNLFIQYADKNKWWHKKHQDSSRDFTSVLGEQSLNNVEYQISLKNVNFEHYPYVDTMYFLSKIDKYISNRRDNMEYEMRSTSGYIEQLD